MKIRQAKYLLSITMGIVITVAQAIAQETDPLDLTEGFTENKLGAKVEKIRLQDKDGIQEVTISIPKDRVAGEIEEVIVTAPAPEKKPVPQAKRYEFIKDYDHDHYGLVIYLGKEMKVPLRLYFSTGPDDE